MPSARPTTMLVSCVAIPLQPFRLVGGHLCPPYPRLRHVPKTLAFVRIGCPEPGALAPPKTPPKTPPKAPSATLRRSLGDLSTKTAQTTENQHGRYCIYKHLFFSAIAIQRRLPSFSLLCGLSAEPTAYHYEPSLQCLYRINIQCFTASAHD